jgi:AcrR family transcriptional regulator
MTVRRQKMQRGRVGGRVERQPAGPAAPAPSSAFGSSEAPKTARQVRSQARREAILAAALDEFSANGFAAARLEDVARRAGIAKGTIYLYFADKEALFQELVRSMLVPLIGNIETFVAQDMPLAVLLERFVDILVGDVLDSRRKDIIRLIISEGPRFPALAQFYHREVLSRLMAALRTVLQRAAARGEIRHRALVDFPQLLAAPALVAILWNGLFGKFAPLDARAMLAGHIDIVLDRRSEP